MSSLRRTAEASAVAQRCEWAAVATVMLDEALGLFDETAVEHGGGALVDAFVEQRARWVQADAEDVVAS